MNGRTMSVAVVAAVASCVVASVAPAATERQRYAVEKPCCQIVSGTRDVSIATARPLIPALYRVRFRVQFDAPPGAAMTCHAGGLAATRPSGSHVQAAAVGYRRVNAGNAPLTLACRLGNAFATARVEHASLELTRVRSAASVQRGSAERCFGYPPRCVAAKHK